MPGRWDMRVKGDHIFEWWFSLHLADVIFCIETDVGNANRIYPRVGVEEAKSLVGQHNFLLNL